jgi:hypothetical protein
MFIFGCITHPHLPNTKPGEITLKYKILEMPLFGQETRVWCWAASGEMIMHYYGEEVPQHVQANNRKRIKGGIVPQFKVYGFNHPKPKNDALSWQELVEQIQAHQPVGFTWAWKTPGSHYMVARGYIILNDTRLVVVNDPLPMNPDKYKGGTVSIMTYDDYVQFSPRYSHWYTHYNIEKAGCDRFLKQKINKKLLRGELNQWASGSVGQWVSSMIGKRSYESLVMMPRPHTETNENQHQRIAQHIGSPRRGAPGRRRQAALEGLKLLKALPWPIQKELGFESKAMVEKSKLGKKSFYTLGIEAGRWQDSEEIPGDALEVHYPVEVEKELVTSITIRKREGKWKFAVINDSYALSAVKTLNEMFEPREPPSYFMVQIQSMNLSFLSYFLKEEGEIEEEKLNLYLVPTQEDPDLQFPLYKRVQAAEVFLELKSLLEQMAEEKGGEALKNQFTGDWNKMDEALEDLDSGEKTRALKGLKSAVEIINNVFAQLEGQNGNSAQ